MPAKTTKQALSAFFLRVVLTVLISTLSGCAVAKTVNYDTMSSEDILFYATNCTKETAHDAAAALGEQRILSVEFYRHTGGGGTQWNVSLPYNELALVLDGEGNLLDLHDRHLSITLYPPGKDGDVSFLTEEENLQFAAYLEKALIGPLGAYKIHYVYGKTLANGERVTEHENARLRDFAVPELWHSLRVGENILLYGYLNLEDAPTNVWPIVSAEFTPAGELIACTVDGRKLI